MLRDIVFEEHYQKKFERAMQQAGNQGFSQGVALLMQCIHEFEANKINITEASMIDYLKTKGLEMRLATEA